MSRQSEAAVARSNRLDRVAVGLVGALAVVAAAITLVVGAGWLGSVRARRPLADPIGLDWLRTHQVLAQLAAVLAGLVLVVLGLSLAVRSARPEPQPDLVLEDAADRLKVTAEAISDAIRVDAERVTGVAEARAMVVRIGNAPALRLYLRLRHGADVRAVWSELNGQVLARARDSLGVPAIPTAVRLELGTAERQRVS